MISNKSFRTTGLSTFAAVLLLLLLKGCFIINMLPAGKLNRYKQQVVLDRDYPDYYAMNADGAPGMVIGTLHARAGDTIKTFGLYSGGRLSTTYFLIMVDSNEVYIDRRDALTADDQLFRQLKNPFSVAFREDFDAWNRARSYIRNHTDVPIEIANDNLIKTSSVSDSTSIHYLVTRLVRSRDVEYEIICRSYVPGFKPAMEARHMAFYMVTGRKYGSDD